MGYATIVQDIESCSTMRRSCRYPHAISMLATMERELRALLARTPEQMAKVASWRMRLERRRMQADRSPPPEAA